MGLVEYSDSDSDNDGPMQPAAAPKVASAAPKPAAILHKAAPGKLQVSLPSVKPEPGQHGHADADGPPAKRARTGGAFGGGFNALLPAPKRATTTTLKKGVNLKTSSEAAFSRNPLPQRTGDDDTYSAPALNDVGESKPESRDELPPEPKMVGKATRFLPLSVSNKKKKKKPLPTMPTPDAAESTASTAETDVPQSAMSQEPPKPKVKKSLFSVAREDEPLEPVSTGEYEPITLERPPASEQEPQLAQPSQPAAPANANSLEAVAADMNLTAAQRRHLFGRKGGEVNVQHFDLDAQYAENERARLAGEVVEHRAVKAVAPGKHSLQQLVNNAQTQQEALQDKWADGKRARGEGGSKYGWSKPDPAQAAIRDETPRELLFEVWKGLAMELTSRCRYEKPD